MTDARSAREEFFVLANSLNSRDTHIVYLEENMMCIFEGGRSVTRAMRAPLVDSIERAELLELFAYLEVLVNELLRLEVRPDSSRAEKLYDLLSSLDLYNKVRILEDWQVVTGTIVGKFHELRKVRNVLAHRWMDEDFEYRGHGVYEVPSVGFDLFSSDFQQVWNGFAEAYMLRQPSLETWVAQLKEQKKQFHE